MSAESGEKPALITINSEGRTFRRFHEGGDVTLKFLSQTVQGRLVNISMNGLLGAFDQRHPLPPIFEKVTIDIKLDKNKSAITDIEGIVARIQFPKNPAASGSVNNIELVIKFNHLSPEKKHAIRGLLSLLTKKARGYPYFK